MKSFAFCFHMRSSVCPSLLCIGETTLSQSLMTF